MATTTPLMQLLQGYLKVTSDRQQTIALETQVQALRIAYRLSLDKYEAGYAPYLDVLTAQRSLFSAEQSLVAAEYQSLAGVIGLYQALGGAWPAHTTTSRPAGP